ncbi:TIR domain-containing protein [uncultured Brachyspira sp.]|uniref:TIR domain-containing protein n=1 Tax=uncultured Brachyspira sp. TaxID=221953 RepID=UPI00259B364C|nr:TIR domain-containing protein [uncultured Brachyspira sp.]
MAKRHKVFVSYHHENDQYYRDLFESTMVDKFDIMVSKSVNPDEVDNNLNTERIRQIIRDDYLKDSTVTVVLIGAETWKRKYVDWEIAASIRDTKNNPRSGLLGIFLPTYHLSSEKNFNPHTIPPRLYYNWKNENQRFAQLYKWSLEPSEVIKWIDRAFNDRNKIIPDNSYPSFTKNRRGERWEYN